MICQSTLTYTGGHIDQTFYQKYQELMLMSQQISKYFFHFHIFFVCICYISSQKDKIVYMPLCLNNVKNDIAMLHEIHFCLTISKQETLHTQTHTLNTIYFGKMYKNWTVRQCQTIVINERVKWICPLIFICSVNPDSKNTG